MKYAIKVPFEDDWLYTTDADAIVTYDTFEEAQENNNKVWSGKGTIVEYGGVRKRIKDEVEETKQDLEAIK